LNRTDSDAVGYGEFVMALRLPTLSPIRAILSSVSVLVAVLATSSIVSAHYSAGQYIYTLDNGGEWKDPVNLVFYSIDAYNPSVPSGWASFGQSVFHVYHHMNWWDHTGSTMLFYDHGFLYNHDDQLADGFLLDWPRQHIRFKEGADADPSWGEYTTAAVHYEDTHICTDGVPRHVAIDFDGKRDFVWSWMNQQDPVNHSGMYTAFSNNTNVSPQCDGSNPHSVDGYVRWIKVT